MIYTICTTESYGQIIYPFQQLAQHELGAGGQNNALLAHRWGKYLDRRERANNTQVSTSLCAEIEDKFR